MPAIPVVSIRGTQALWLLQKGLRTVGDHCTPFHAQIQAIWRREEGPLAWKLLIHIPGSTCPLLTQVFGLPDRCSSPALLMPTASGVPDGDFRHYRPAFHPSQPPTPGKEPSGCSVTLGPFLRSLCCLDPPLSTAEHSLLREAQQAQFLLRTGGPTVLPLRTGGPTGLQLRTGGPTGLQLRTGGHSDPGWWGLGGVSW